MMECYYTMAEARRATGLTQLRLESIFEREGVSVEDGIPSDIIKTIIQEQEVYISFRDFAAMPRDGNYDGSTAGKNKLLDELEVNEYFGIETLDPQMLLIGTPRDQVFFRKTDIPKLEEELACYFGVYKLSEEEKLTRLLNETDRKSTRRCLEDYMESTIGKKEIKPAFVEFVRIMLALPDLPKIEDTDIKQILKLQMTATAKNILINFLNYGRNHTGCVKYSQMKQAERESNPIPAYSDETYLALAKCIFNAEYIAKNRMIERALQNHFFIEMWLYLALHFCCGWRAADICKGWKYLRLCESSEDEYGFRRDGINIETLYEDILYDRIPDETYEKVCNHAINGVIAANQSNSKTKGAGAPPLVISITSELRTFFGLLTLISEAVMLRDHDGYMKPNRESAYQSKKLYSKFFGREMYDVLHGKNIHSRRLNKDYLQGVEETARQTGCGSLMASALASYARNHTNLNTIAHYLEDHALNAENADMVLYFMMERGVFGFEVYQALKAAYPDAFERLPMKKQNELMDAVGHNPFRVELGLSGFEASLKIKTAFENGDNGVVLAMLKSMYEITQGRGKGKDEGIYCSLRASGTACVYPEYESCLAHGCPHLVFTKYGYKALLEVIGNYVAAIERGDKKKFSVLRLVIMPRFTEIINTLIKDVSMDKKERAGLKLMLEEVLNNGG